MKINGSKELAVLIFCGRVFHNFAAECIKERSNSADCDLGIGKRPLSDDLMDRLVC